MNKSYYIDACIYLNLWQKESDKENNILYWKIAENFLKKIDDEKIIVYYSGFLLKELMFILNPQEYLNKRELFDSSPNYKKIILSNEEYNLAKKIKLQNNSISLYDVIHMLCSKKTNSILITRDKSLIEFAKSYSVEVKKPEEIL